MIPIMLGNASVSIGGKSYVPLLFLDASAAEIEKLNYRHFERFGKPANDGNIFVCHKQTDLNNIFVGRPSPYPGSVPFIGYREFSTGKYSGYIYCDGLNAITCVPQSDSAGYNFYNLSVAFSPHSNYCYESHVRTTLNLNWGIATYFTSHPSSFPKTAPPPKVSELLSVLSTCTPEDLSPVKSFLGASDFRSVNWLSGAIRIGSYLTFLTPPEYYYPPEQYISGGNDYCAAYYYLVGGVHPHSDGSEPVHSPLGEYAWVSDTFELVALPYLDDALSEAAFDLYRSLPKAQANGIANIIDIISTIRSLRSGLSGIGKLSDIWLGYRYQYSTTVMDIKEYAKLCYRLMDLVDQEYTLYGSYSRKYTTFSSGGPHTYDVIAKCTAKTKFTEIDTGKIRYYLDQWGIKLNLQNAWDLIPYSFIVDWFLPVQELLANLDTMYDEQHFIQSVYSWCSSVQIKFESDQGAICNYCRKVGYKPPLRVTSAISGSDPNKGFSFYHVADALALWR